MEALGRQFLSAAAAAALLGHAAMPRAPGARELRSPAERMRRITTAQAKRKRRAARNLELMERI